MRAGSNWRHLNGLSLGMMGDPVRCLPKVVHPDVAALKLQHNRMLRGFDLIELQADELCTFVGNKNKTVWLFATIEVSSCLWAGSVLGRRSDQNARAVINDVVRRGRVVGCPLIATDGFEYYLGAVGDLVGSACVYGQVLKTRRNNRVIRVERRVKIGTATRLQAVVGVGGFRDPEHLVR